jgi:hypothetical protein
VISGSNSLWERGYGTPEPQTVITVGFDAKLIANFFASCELGGTLENQAHVNNEETTRHQQFFICRQPRLPWSEMWKNMRWYE